MPESSDEVPSSSELEGQVGLLLHQLGEMRGRKGWRAAGASSGGPATGSIGGIVGAPSAWTYMQLAVIALGSCAAGPDVAASERASERVGLGLWRWRVPVAWGGACAAAVLGADVVARSLRRG